MRVCATATYAVRDFARAGEVIESAPANVDLIRGFGPLCALCQQQLGDAQLKRVPVPQTTTSLIFMALALRPSTSSSVTMLLALASSAAPRCNASPARRLLFTSIVKMAARWNVEGLTGKSWRSLAQSVRTIAMRSPLAQSRFDRSFV